MSERTERHQGWALRCTAGSVKGQVFPILQRTVLGRTVGVEIALTEEPTLARRHALFTVTGDGLEVMDLGSGTGSFLNGALFSTATARVGDVLRFGALELVVELASPTQPKAPEVDRLTGKPKSKRGPWLK